MSLYIITYLTIKDNKKLKGKVRIEKRTEDEALLHAYVNENIKGGAIYEITSVVVEKKDNFINFFENILKGKK
jgi:hypothetical protein